MATLTPSGQTMNMTLPISASIALCRIYTTIGNAFKIHTILPEQQRITDSIGELNTTAAFSDSSQMYFSKHP